MVRHNDMFMQANSWELPRQGEPGFFCNLPKLRQLHPSLLHVAEGALLEISADGYEITAGSGIGVAFQPSFGEFFHIRDHTAGAASCATTRKTESPTAKAKAGAACCDPTRKKQQAQKVGYLRRAPTSTSSAKPARTGRPSGPTEAATIIPLDSTPRSLRGARFTTTTTFRPTKDSGS
jgi:hypothetical protein